MKRRFLLVPLLAGAALPFSGFAQTENDFQIYAAMSKLEANAAEASGGLALFVLNNGNEAEYAEDYADDVTTFYGYLRAIEALEITPEQQEIVDQLRDTWGPIEDEGEEIIAALQDGSTAAELTDRVNSWYDSLDELDDVLDTALSSLLEANDITVAPISRDGTVITDDDGDVGDNADGDNADEDSDEGDGN
jgi:hypothetical protein